jgi:hypothetical protein
MKAISNRSSSPSSVWADCGTIWMDAWRPNAREHIGPCNTDALCINIGDNRAMTSVEVVLD